MDIPANAITDAAPPVIAAAPLAPGALIAARYRVQARLGSGGGGTVWRCLDDKLGAVVALKVVSAGGDAARWHREVAMARRIASRNVCRVHDLGEDGELRFVTMELVEGESLRAWIARGLPGPAARDLFAQVVAGAAANPGAVVVHRDLKPENIVVAGDGRAVIVDFGLAREPGGATVTFSGGVVGTPRYMSPEQAAGQAVDARADVWALGLIGHELLTGALPLLDEHGRRIDPAVEASWPGIAPVLRRCLALAPDERFADARRLEHALAAIGRRRRGARAVIGAAVVGAIAGGVVLARSISPAPDDGGERAVRQPSELPQPPRPPEPVVARPMKTHRLTTTEPKSWPADAPISVALSPDATRFAYTTAEPRLLVRAIGDGAPVAWSIPALEKRSRSTDPPESVLATMWAVGWFSDGSIAILGTTGDGGHRLDRVHPGGRSELLYRDAQRFAAAVTPVGDRVVVEVSESAMLMIAAAGGPAPGHVATVARGEHVLALAWSPDGSQIAVARQLGERGETAAIRVMAATGGGGREVWRGQLTGVGGQLLAWIDDHRLAFAASDLAAGHARLHTLEVRRATASLRSEWPGYAGAGSAARGRLLVVRGDASPAVQVGDQRASRLERMHPRRVRAGHLAGWTSRGEVVFAVGAPGEEQIVAAKPGEAPRSWPGTRPGELPDTLAGDQLIAHRRDGAWIVVERITADGERAELTRVPAGDAAVRCAGDRAAPCVLEHTDGNLVRWTAIDVDTGALGALIHQRPLRDRFAPSAALSPDGKLLAVADGGDAVTLVDRATGAPEPRRPSAGEGAALRSLGFAPDGDLWATATSFEGQLFGLMAFSRLDSGRISSSESSRGKPWHDRLRWFSQPRPSPDGTQVAIGTLELEPDVWQIDGL